MNELDLVRRAKAGDERAMAELLVAHVAQAHRLAQHVVRDEADAEDATQNAFVKAFTNLERFDEQRPFGPWLLRIVTNEALNLRRAGRSRFAFWQRYLRLEASEETVESLVQVRVEHEELRRALNLLKTTDRVVLTLSYFMGMSEIEVADSLGIKRGAVKKRKHDALKRLRALVKRDFPELGGLAVGSPRARGTTR